MADFDSITEPLPNGAKLPDHPSDTTAKRIVEYGPVLDATDGTRLRGGLHNNEVSVLMNGEVASLAHLYYYAIRDRRIYHTRPAVIIHCLTELVVE